VAELEFNIFSEFAERIDSKYGAKISDYKFIGLSKIAQMERIRADLQSELIITWSEFEQI